MDTVDIICTVLGVLAVVGIPFLGAKWFVTKKWLNRATDTMMAIRKAAADDKFTAAELREIIDTALGK